MFQPFITSAICAAFSLAHSVSNSPMANHLAEQRMLKEHGLNAPVWYNDSERIPVLVTLRSEIDKFAQRIDKGLKAIGWTPSVGMIYPLAGKFVRGSKAYPIGFREAPKPLPVWNAQPTYPLLNYGFGLMNLEPNYCLQTRSQEEAMTNARRGLAMFREQYPIPPEGFLEGEAWIHHGAVTEKDECENGEGRRIIVRTPDEIEWYDAMKYRLENYFETIFLLARSYASVKTYGRPVDEVQTKLGSMKQRDYDLAYRREVAMRPSIF